jgi:hypothetical protein
VKAIGYVEFGGPEVLHVVELPDPVPGQGQVRVRVRAAAVSPTDTLWRAGIRARDGQAAEELSEEEKPKAPGMEFAGVLEEIGPGSETPLAVGDHVMGCCGRREPTMPTPSRSWYPPNRLFEPQPDSTTAPHRRCRCCLPAADSLARLASSVFWVSVRWVLLARRSPMPDSTGCNRTIDSRRADQPIGQPRGAFIGS